MKLLNDDLIRQLKEERDAMYPNGCPTHGRGFGKTYLHMANFLRWYAYGLYMDIYKLANVKVDIETARKEIDKFVVAQMPDY